MRNVIAAFGLVVAMAGIEHGIGEILEGPVAPPALVFRSWPDTAAFEVLNGEPALTIIPNLLVAGVLTITVSVVFAVWAVGYAHRPRGAIGLFVLSILLLLAGGGVAPPVIGVVLAIAAARIGAPARLPGTVTRRIAPAWRGALALGVAAYLVLFPGMVLASAVFGFESELLVLALSLLAFGGLFGALVAARANDRIVANGIEAAR
jgi:hypothetical protein